LMIVLMAIMVVVNLCFLLMHIPHVPLVNLGYAQCVSESCPSGPSALHHRSEPCTSISTHTGLRLAHQSPPTSV
jgi:hypothetical protein